MKSDQNTNDPEQVVMGRLVELVACLPELGRADVRAAVVELLATQKLPPAGLYGQRENGQQTVKLVVPDDPGGQPVEVILTDLDTAESVVVVVAQLEARAMVTAAGVVAKTRELVADTYAQMLAELDYQAACYRRGQAPQHPEERVPDVQTVRDGDGAVIGWDVTDPDAEPIVMLRGRDGVLRFPDARPVGTADVARLLGFDDRQTARLQAITENAGDCPHTGLPPANSVAPFERRVCPVCGQRMQAYPASTNDTGKPEWSAIP